MPETKSALIVANWEYQDADLRHLLAPANDAEALASILRDSGICGFDVTTLLNRSSHDMSEEVERFFLNRRRDDLLLLYFSCHGIKDDDGCLYFAATDTRLIDHGRPMRSTALSAEFVRTVMQGSNSRRQVLMLDCCYSGAFASAMLSKGDKSAGVKDQFEQGRGMVVITASDAIQYSFEEDKVEGDAVESIFTKALVQGIKTGEADLDRDGSISLDELYDYVYARVVEQNANQRPRKWTLEVEGKIIVAQSPVIRPAELPADLLAAISSPLSRIRLGAVSELGDLMGGGHKGLALAAREALQKLEEDDSRNVSSAAQALLGSAGKSSALSSEPAAPPPQIPEKPEVRAAPPELGKADAVAKREPDNVVGKTPWKWIFHRPYPAALVLLAAVVSLSIWWYRSAHPSKPSLQTQSGQSSTASSLPANPIVLPRPPFDYSLAGERAEDSTVRLTEVSHKGNGITDDEEWFGSNDLALPTLVVPNPFKQEVGNIPQQIPVKQGDNLLVTAIKEGNQLLCIYGRDFASGRYLTSFDLTTGKPTFAFDFHEFMMPPKYLNADRDYVEEPVTWAAVKDNVLYVSNDHRTYAKSSYGLNAYLTAIDTGSGRLLWRSAPLVNNASNFLLYQDAIIAGYGFTSESHFLYVLNQKDGRIVQTIKLVKSPEYILNKGDSIFVRTYDTDYVFKAITLPLPVPTSLPSAQ